MKFKNILSLLGLCSLVACAPTSDNATNFQEPLNCETLGQSYGIVGGEILSSGNPLSSATVMVLHRDSNNEISVCTGTLIDKDKVLTAAHCTSETGKNTIAFTNNLSCASRAPQRTLRSVTAKVIHPDYDFSDTSTAKAAYDLALLKFSGDLPAGYEIRPLLKSRGDIAQSSELIMSGYGITSEEAEDTGLLRFTRVSPRKLIPRAEFAYKKTIIEVPLTLMIEQYKTGVCQGDSGGALYANFNGELQLVGVTSMGVDNRAMHPLLTRVCHGISLFTDVQAHSDWIEKNLQSL